MSATPPGSRDAPVALPIAFIHLLRGLAALLVVWTHLVGLWHTLDGGESALQVLWVRAVVLPLHVDAGLLGVLLFFFVSGYIITHTSLREDRRAFVVKRLLRIFPPLWFALAVLLLVQQYGDRVGLPLRFQTEASSASWWRAPLLLDGLIGTPVLGVTWTLVIEVAFYTLVFTVLSGQRRRPLASTWTLVVAAAALSIVILALPRPDGGTLGGLIGVSFLIIGRALYLAQRRLIPPRQAGLIVLVSVASLVVFTELDRPGSLLSPGPEPAYSSLITMGLALGVFALAMVWNPRRVPTPFVWLADTSYSLYLLHVPVGFLILDRLSDLAVPRSLASLLAIAGCMVVASLSHRLVERPAQRLARRVSRRSPASVVPGPVAEQANEPVLVQNP